MPATPFGVLVIFFFQTVHNIQTVQVLASARVQGVNDNISSWSWFGGDGEEDAIGGGGGLGYYFFLNLHTQ